MWIIVYGNPIEGLSFIGPFESEIAAIEHANKDADLDADWWFAEIEAP